MKRPNIFRRLARKVSNFARGAVIVIGTLFGVKKVEEDKFNSTGLATAGWVFMLGIPVGLVLLGPQFPMLTWLALVMCVLMLVNLDDALLLTAKFAEDGVDGLVQEVPA